MVKRMEGITYDMECVVPFLINSMGKSSLKHEAEYVKIITNYMSNSILNGAFPYQAEILHLFQS